MSGDVVARCMAMVAPAETAFRSRWKLSTLKRINASLHDLLVEQIHLYDTALVTGTDAETKLQAEAMVRGWRAACAALESPLMPDDAYLTGWDPNTGTKVIIADQQGSIGRIQRVQGDKVVMVTPDEVAKLVGGMHLLVEAKSFFPDADVLEVQPHVH